MLKQALRVGSKWNSFLEYSFQESLRIYTDINTNIDIRGQMCYEGQLGNNFLFGQFVLIVFLSCKLWPLRVRTYSIFPEMQCV